MPLRRRWLAVAIVMSTSLLVASVRPYSAVAVGVADDGRLPASEDGGELPRPWEEGGLPVEVDPVVDAMQQAVFASSGERTVGQAGRVCLRRGDQVELLHARPTLPGRLRSSTAALIRQISSSETIRAK